MEKAEKIDSEERKKAPWITESTLQVKHSLVRLHNEILDFCAYVSPSKLESSRREKAIKMYSIKFLLTESLLMQQIYGQHAK